MAAVAWIDVMVGDLDFSVTGMGFNNEQGKIPSFCTNPNNEILHTKLVMVDANTE